MSDVQGWKEWDNQHRKLVRLYGIRKCMIANGEDASLINKAISALTKRVDKYLYGESQMQKWEESGMYQIRQPISAGG